MLQGGPRKWEAAAAHHPQGLLQFEWQYSMIFKFVIFYNSFRRIPLSNKLLDEIQMEGWMDGWMDG
jgi:hypothetical protein